jgi:ABC-type multidrug transport system ATPase subunit
MCKREREGNCTLFINVCVQTHTHNFLIGSFSLLLKGVGGMPKKVAVNNLTMGIEEGECFGFLGPNGYVRRV